VNSIEKIKTFILNNSIKANLLSLYLVIVVIMSFLLATMFFYSIDLNRTYNKIISNFGDYNKIYYQINSIDKDIYMNITEQRTFDGGYYKKTLGDINREFIEIGNNLDENQSGVSVEVLKRTINTLGKYIDETGELISSNSSYASREDQLNVITRIKDIVKDNTQELMQLDIKQSQMRINRIKSSYNIALMLIAVMFFISIIISIGFLLLVLKDTVNKINIVSNHANSLANGDQSTELIDFSEANEFHVLAKSFNKMKNNIKDYVDKLSSSEMRISSILNTLNDCIITTNSSGKVESCNDAIEKIFNYQKSEVIGKNINEFISAIDFSRYQYEMFNSQKLIKNVKIIDNKYQIGATKKCGIIIPIEVSYNEVEVEGQRVTTFVIHDITQHKNLEKMKDEFISIVSHELRTPLTSIKGALGLVTAGVLGLLPDKVNEMLSIASNNCTRLSDLIDDILDMEKIKAGKLNFVIKEYDIVDIVKESIEASNEYARQYSVDYKLVNSIDSAKIDIDKNRLIQVMLNLLSNAAKFSHANSTVSVGLDRFDGGVIRISIQDKGIGIPEDFQPRVFNNFSQADSSDARKKGGTGLGLSITKELINIMGGNISFESIQNEGSTFYIDLPEKIAD